MKKLLSFLISALIIVFVAVGVMYYTAMNSNLETIPSDTVNGVAISADSVDYTKEIIPYLPKLERSMVLESNVPTFEIFSQNLPFTVEGEYTADIYFTERHEEVLSDSNDITSFNFSEIGEYVIFITKAFTDDGVTGYYSYSFIVKTIENPIISISNTSPSQGELVFVDIENVFNEYDVIIDSKYAPSASIFNADENKISFYIPINYMVATSEFTLDITLENEENSYNFTENITVLPTEYETISFTIDESVTSTTVNSAAANQEYRDIIHPLYYTKDLNVYWEGNFIKPTEETRVSSDFGQIRYINGAYSRHSGIDYAAATGTPIYASNSGIIEYSGFLQLSGNTVVIEHGLGLKGYYMHMDSLSVSTGDFVNKGDLIGTVGTTGYSTGPHLHYQVSIENQPVDPVDLYTLFPE